MVDRQRKGSADPWAADSEPLELIRVATAQCHRELEACLNWSLAFSSAANYWRLLQRFQRVVQPLDARASAFLTSAPAGFDSVHRTNCLTQDLTATALQLLPVDRARLDAAGLEPAEHSFKPDLSYIVDEATAIGSLYVLEGSALGGQLLARLVQQQQTHWDRPPVAAEPGPAINSYFLGRGQGTASYWRSFCQWLNDRLRGSNRAQAAAEAANRTFSCFQTSLSGSTHA